MSGIYIHIPFCKQACHYCDFHFSTSLKKKDEMLMALAKEIQLRKDEMNGILVETIYFGGGTPSVLAVSELDFLLKEVYQHFNVAEAAEITLEANPDDLGIAPYADYLAIGINRLSIGVQSFFDADLKWMHRAHHAMEAKACLQEATRYFDNISIDLIYGIPGMTATQWQENIQTALDFGIPHLSSYALTVEPKTALHTFIQKGVLPMPDDAVAQEHFSILVQLLNQNGFVHYELSNFGKEGYFSKNNSSYWLGKPYLGIGPSAHSFNGTSRSWNIANNSKYIQSIQLGVRPSESEILTLEDRYNEYIMTGLRTIWGVSLSKVRLDFGSDYLLYMLDQADRFIKDGLLIVQQDVLRTTNKGKFLCDGIASDLFKIS